MTPDRPLRVLLVDDDPGMLEMLEAILCGPTIEVVGLAANGTDAVRVAETIAPDVAVVDYMMPGMDGFQTAAGIKAVRSDCAVLIFSALDLDDEALANPAVDAFLKKSDVARLEDVIGRIGTEIQQ